MYGLYDREGILRFVNADRDACIAYAELFELDSSDYCLMNLVESETNLNQTILDLNQVVNNN